MRLTARAWRPLRPNATATIHRADDAHDTIEQDHNISGLNTDRFDVHADRAWRLAQVADSAVGARHACDGRHPYLYLDWEWNAPRHKGRKRRIFGTDRIPGLFYLRCQSPLTIEVDRIRRFADKHGIGSLVWTPWARG